MLIYYWMGTFFVYCHQYAFMSVKIPLLGVMIDNFLLNTNCASIVEVSHTLTKKSTFGTNERKGASEPSSPCRLREEPNIAG